MYFVNDVIKTFTINITFVCSIRSIMHKYMEKNKEVSFEKIFFHGLGMCKANWKHLCLVGIMPFHTMQYSNVIYSLYVLFRLPSVQGFL